MTDKELCHGFGTSKMLAPAGDEAQLGENWEHLAKEGELVYDTWGMDWSFFDKNTHPEAIVYSLDSSIKLMGWNNWSLVPRSTIKTEYLETTASTILPSGTSLAIHNRDISEIWSNLTYVPDDFTRKIDNLEVRSLTLI